VSKVEEYTVTHVEYVVETQSITIINIIQSVMLKSQTYLTVQTLAVTVKRPPFHLNFMLGHII